MKTYAGIPTEYAQKEQSEIVLIPVPYDGTSTWKKGADKGPDAFLHASENMELYDIETDSEVYKHGIYLDTPVNENTSPEAMVDAVCDRVETYLQNKKFVTLFGGEHSISIGSIRAFKKHFEKLTVLQIDAHADLRPSYEGSTCNHACAVFEASKTTNLIQVGIRSMDASENEHMDRNNVFFAHELSSRTNWIQEVLDKCKGPLFITIDLDGFDSGIMPSTGTPEPGGMSWEQVTNLLKAVCSSQQVVGFDIVELCPNAHNAAPDFLAAKLYYKLLSYVFNR